MPHESEIRGKTQKAYMQEKYKKDE